MENKNGNQRGDSVVGKIGSFLRKLYHFRLKVDRKGEPVVNVSSIFGLACLLYAPFLTLGGVVVSLLLGYQIHFENEADDGELEEQIRRAAQNVKTGAVNAANSIRKELNKVRTENASAGTAGNAGNAADKAVENLVKAVDKPVNSVENSARAVGNPANSVGKDAGEAVEKIVEKIQEPALSNEELLQELKLHAEEPRESNPAATTFHSAYAASAGTVPVLQVSEEPEASNEAPAQTAKMSQ